MDNKRFYVLTTKKRTVRVLVDTSNIILQREFWSLFKALCKLNKETLVDWEWDDNQTGEPTPGFKF